MTLRIATRSSALARFQANAVADALRSLDPGLEVELIATDTVGDRRTDVTIASLGGQGVFVKEIQQLVLDGHADVAVHSAKDLTSSPTAGLNLAAFTERGPVGDALVGRSLAGLGPGATVACGAPRRRAVLSNLRPDLNLVELRGNIATRIAKLDERGVDAVVVAVAALERLDLSHLVAEEFDPTVLVPQVGQGAFALECRSDDHEVAARLVALDHGPTRDAVTAERAFLAELGGGCAVPAAAWATTTGDGLTLRGLLAAPDGSVVLRGELHGARGPGLGVELAAHLRDGRGGAALMERWSTR